jgi:hypothetical protein
MFLIFVDSDCCTSFFNGKLIVNLPEALNLAAGRTDNDWFVTLTDYNILFGTSKPNDLIYIHWDEINFNALCSNYSRILACITTNSGMQIKTPQKIKLSPTTPLLSTIELDFKNSKNGIYPIGVNNGDRFAGTLLFESA